MPQTDAHGTLPAMQAYVDHRLAEERSLALHHEVARQVRDNPALLARAHANVERWMEQGTMVPVYGDAWRRMLEGPVETLLAFLVENSEWAKTLRQNTPFTFIVSPRDRWRLWRQTRSHWEDES